MINPVSISAFTAPLAGLQQAQSQMDQAAVTVANPGLMSDTVSLSEALVSMKMAEISFKANVQAIKAENDILGNLINTVA